MVRRKGMEASVILAALLLSCLCACGKSTADEDAVAEAAIVAETEREASPAEDAENAVLPEAATEGPLNETDPAEKDAERPDWSDGASAPVENNGSYFVRVGDDVWFRQQQPEIVNAISLGGQTFSENPAPETTNADGPPPSICRYDLKEGRYYDLIRDTERGFGPLYYADEKLYSMRAKGEYGVEVYRMNLDGSAIETICAGGIVDITENGTLIISPETETGYALYKNGEQISSYATEDGWIAYCGSAGDEIFFLYGGESDDCFLQELSPDGSVIRLGRLPSAPTECQDFVFDEENVYLLLARREGTARSIGERFAIKAIPGREGSIEELPAENLGDPDDGNAYLLFVGDGNEAMVASYYAGELALSEGFWGNLVLFDSPYSAERLITDFIPSDPYGTEDTDQEIVFVQSLAYIGGTAFISTAVANRAPDEDIGWRMAYRLRYFQTDFLRVFDYETGERLVHDGDATHEK